MNKIKIFVGGNADGFVFETSENFGLKNFLDKNSQVTIVNSLDKADVLVLIDMDYGQLKKFRKISKFKTVILVRYEPRVVMPHNYNKFLLSKINHIIDVGRSSERKNDEFFWPQDLSVTRIIGKDLLVTKRDFSKIVIINSNKLSLVKDELYSLRRKCIKKIIQIDLFGNSWDISTNKKIKIFFDQMKINMLNLKYPKIIGNLGWFCQTPSNWKGTTESKIETLSKYYFSLVIENSSTYLTEKIFDCFKARTIPIYVGPDVKLFGIPSDLVIQVQPNLNDIKLGIDRAKNVDYPAWKENVDNWLKDSEVIKKFEMTSVLSSIENKIVELSINSAPV